MIGLQTSCDVTNPDGTSTEIQGDFRETLLFHDK